MQLLQVELELGDHREHQLGQQRGVVGVEQTRERAPDAIVVERSQPLAAQPQQARLEAPRPRAETVDGLAPKAEVADDDADRLGRREAQASIASGQVAL